MHVLKEIRASGEHLMRTRSVFRCLFLGVLGLTLFLAACDSPQVKLPLDQQIYTLPAIVDHGDINTLDPALANDPTSLHVTELLYSGLVQFNDNLEVSPSLAQSWEQDSSGLVWTFHLKPDLTFRDGSRLTADDVVFSLDRALQPATQSPTAPYYLSLIEGTQSLLQGSTRSLIGTSLLAPDAQTVQIKLSQPAPYFLSMLAYPCAFVLSKTFLQEQGVQFTEHLSEGGTSGPFQLNTWNHHVSLELIPNVHYSPQPQLQKLILTLFPSDKESYNYYLNQKVDETAIPPESLAEARKRQDLVNTPLLSLDYYGMNQTVKPLQNVKVRQALALALNKDALVKSIWQDTMIASNHLVPQGMPGYNSQLNGVEGNQSLSGNSSKAKELLTQGLKEMNFSGPDKLPAMTLGYPANQPMIDAEVKQVVQTWKEQLNVTITAVALPEDTLQDRILLAKDNESLALWRTTWQVTYPDPQQILSYNFEAGSPGNNTGYANKQMLQAFVNADRSRDQGERLKQYQQIEQEIVTEAVWIPVFQRTVQVLRTEKVVHVSNNALRMYLAGSWQNVYRIE
jgi:peptide/nickel transport system substrate-binding protein/oligopeptide transport system substrate-binding protein